MATNYIEQLFSKLVSFNLLTNGINTELNEMLGCPDEVYKFSNIFIKAVADQINNSVSEKKSSTVTYTENDIDPSAANLTFFKKFSITLKLDYSAIFLVKDINSAKFSIEKSKFIRQNDGTYIIYPVISINVGGIDPVGLGENVFLEIGHELTHCYSLYNLTELVDLLIVVFAPGFFNGFYSDSSRLIFSDCKKGKKSDSRQNQNYNCNTDKIPQQMTFFLRVTAVFDIVIRFQFPTTL